MISSSRRSPIALVVGLVGIAALAMALACAPPARADAGYEVAPVPRWVEVHDLPVAVDGAPESDAGVRYLLSDVQFDLRTDEMIAFHHLGMHLTNEVGVESHSKIEIAYAPGYQSLELHYVRIRRGDRTLDRLATAKVERIQRQRSLDAQIFDDTETLVILLRDVRPEDTLEYAYTRRGDNPVFAPHRQVGFGTTFSVPVERLRARVLWPRGVPHHIRYDGPETPPTYTRERDGHVEIAWVRDATPPITTDPDTPGWYDPRTYVSINDFDSWNAVARWAAPLYPVAAPKGVARVIDEIRSASETKAERLLAATRYVQEKIRYLSIAVGRHSHEPTPPDVTLERRFGDCKDKSLLLATILSALEIDAHVALVHSTLRRGVADAPPSPLAFDHAIVHARLDGESHWIDPTLLYDRNPLELYRSSIYEAALVVANDGDMTTIAAPKSAQHRREVRVSLDLAAETGPVDLEITTTSYGRSANQVRYYFRSTGREEVDESYRAFYASTYPGIETVDLPSFRDDPDRNVVEVTERYRVPALWSEPGSSGAREADLYAVEIARALPPLHLPNRKDPLALEFPFHMSYEIRAAHAKGWEIPSEEVTLQAPGITGSFATSVEKKTLVLRWNVETLVDHVEPSLASTYREEIAALRRHLRYGVTSAVDVGAAGPDALNWPLAFLAIFALAAAVQVARSAYRTRPAAGVEPAQETLVPPGQQGWLAVLGVFLMVRTFAALGQLAEVGYVFGIASWARVTDPASADYVAGLAPTVILVLVGDVALVVFWLAAVAMWAAQRPAFPRFTTVLLIGAWLFTTGAWLVLAALMNESLAPADAGAAAVSLGLVVGWTAYLRTSRRVRSTFRSSPHAHAAATSRAIPPAARSVP